MPPSRVAFFLFPGVTLLDFVGAYDALRRAPGVRCTLLGSAPEVSDDGGARLLVDAVYPALDDHDLLVVPGGLGTRPLEHDARCIDYLRSWGRERPIASVCTGALLLGRAGHLTGLRATTHHAFYDDLVPYCGEVVRDVRVVDAGRVMTATTVSAAIDLGLALVDRHYGPAERARIQRAMGYVPPA